MKIGTRLILGFGVVTILMIAVGLYSIDRIGALDEEVNLLAWKCLGAWAWG